MNRLLKLYDTGGRWGNIILLCLLIVSGLFNRFYVAVKLGYLDYQIEIVIIGLAFYFVYRIYKKRKFEFTNQKLFKFILLAGIIFRIIIAIHDFYDRPVQVSDYAKHEKLGERLATEGEFYDFTGVELRNFRQPGLPAMFAAGLLIYNHPVTYAVIMILFSFGVLISGYFLFRDLRNIASLISFVYLSISPNMLFMASNSNTQLSFFFFIILLFIALKNYTGKISQMLLIGAILAAEMYIRFNFLMVFLLIPFFYEKHRDKDFSYFISRLGYVYMFFLIFYSPWIIRNYEVYGKIRLLPTAGLGLYSANVTTDYTRMGGYNGVPDSVLNKYSDLSEIEFDKAMTKETMEFVRSNPGLIIKGLPFRLMKYSDRQNWTTSYFFDDSKYSSKESLKLIFESIENYFFWIILFLPLMYLFRLKKFPAISVYIFWAYLTYTMVLFPNCTLSRYNFPYILFPLFAVSFVKKDENPLPIKK
jgi:hypothetical protein